MSFSAAGSSQVKKLVITAACVLSFAGPQAQAGIGPRGDRTSGNPDSKASTPKPAKDKACEDALTADAAVDDVLAGWLAQKEEAAKPAPIQTPEQILAGLKNAAEKVYEKLPSLARLALEEGPVVSKIKDSEKFSQSVGAVNQFFRDLDELYFEREDLVTVLKASLITKSALLIVGPGGTGKSEVADNVGDNLVDAEGKTSFFQLQLTPDTSMGEVMGGLVTDKMLEGEMLRRWEKGVLGSKFVFLDEFFDGRLKFLRSFLKAFNERKYTQGEIVEAGLTRTFVAATNKYLNEIFELAGNNSPQALIDRFQFVYYAPGVLQNMSSIFDIFDRKTSNLGKIKFEDLDVISSQTEKMKLSRLHRARYFYIFNNLRRALKAKEVSSREEYMKARDRGEFVQPPYYSTRVFSPRSFVIGARILPFMALERLTKGISNPEIPEIEFQNEDVDMLARRYLVMQGPTEEKLDRLIDDETNPAELSQLGTLKIESEALEEVLEDLQDQEDIWKRKITNAKKTLAKGDPTEILNSLIPLLDEASLAVGDIERTEEVSAEQVAALEAWHKMMNDPEIRKYIRD